MAVLEDLYTDFLAYCKVERGFSPRTVKGYATRLNNFGRFLTASRLVKSPSLTDFTPANCRAYMYYLTGEKACCPNTVHSAFASLIGLGDFCIRNGLLSDSPARAVSLPKKNAPEQKYASDAEVSALIAACDRLSPDRRSKMAKAIVCTFAYSGLRRSELLNLKQGDISLPELRITVRCGKGGKRREVHIPDSSVAEWEEAYSEWCKVRNASADKWAFPLDRRRRICDRGLRVLFEEVKKAAGLEQCPHVMPHAIRRNYATRALRGGANISDIQAALGHASIATTSQYLHMDSERQKLAANFFALKKPSEERTKHSSPAASVNTPKEAQPQKVMPWHEKKRRIRTHQNK